MAWEFTTEAMKARSRERAEAGDPGYIGFPKRCAVPGCNGWCYIDSGHPFCMVRPGEQDARGRPLKGCWDRLFPIEWRFWYLCRSDASRRIAWRVMLLFALRWNMDNDEGADFPGAEATKESEKAIYIAPTKEIKGGWVPKSVIHDDSEVFKRGHKGKLILKHWFAEKNGWLS